MTAADGPQGQSVRERGTFGPDFYLRGQCHKCARPAWRAFAAGARVRGTVQGEAETSAKETIMQETQKIQENMPVVCSNNKQFGTVDHMDGGNIKLMKDQNGEHHWIPASWVTTVDDKVHVDRPGSQAMREWLSTPPEARRQM